MFLSKLKHPHLSVVINIDSDTVGVGLTAVKEGARPELLFVARASHEKKSVKAVLRELFGKLQKEGPSAITEVWHRSHSKHIDHIVVALSAPHSHSRLIAKVKDEPQESVEEYIYDKDIVSLSANGYAMDPALWGKQKGEFEADILLSSCKKDFKQDVENEIAHAFGTKRGIVFKSFLSVYHTFLPQTLKRFGTSVMIYTTGFVTEIVVYENSHIKKLATINLGVNQLLVDIGQKVNASSPLIRSALTSVAEGALLPEPFATYTGALDDFGRKWVEVWQKELGDLKPDNVIVLGRALESAVMKDAFKLLAPNTKVVSVYEDKLFSRQTGDIHKTDEGLSTLALYSNSLL